MKIITQPSVYLIAKTVTEPAALRKFAEDNDIVSELYNNKVDVPYCSDAERLSEVAGRLCYWSFDNPRPGGNSEYLGRIKEQKHGSVLEAASFSFLVTGVSRSLTHELVRHRAGFAFSQLSQRYVDESDCAFVVPYELLGDGKGREYFLWAEGCKFAHQQYSELVTELEKQFHGSTTKTELRKRVRQTARSVLPNCTETKIVVTANCRAWRHFLEQRGSEGAEPEIRRLANVIYDMLLADSPNMFGDYEVTPYHDGTRILKAKYQKV